MRGVSGIEAVILRAAAETNSYVENGRDGAELNAFEELVARGLVFKGPDVDESSFEFGITSIGRAVLAASEAAP